MVFRAAFPSWKVSVVPLCFSLCHAASFFRADQYSPVHISCILLSYSPVNRHLAHLGFPDLRCSFTPGPDYPNRSTLRSLLSPLEAMKFVHF